MAEAPPFDWADQLIKRWPLILFLISGVAWTSRIQVVQTAMAAEYSEIKQQVYTTAQQVAELRAEMPYVREKINKIDSKLDRILEKV